MDSITLWRWASIAMWLAIAVMLSPAIWRMVRRRPRSLDPIWGVGVMECANRLAFLFDALLGGGAMLEWCYASSIIVAALYVAITWRYQRHDS